MVSTPSPAAARASSPIVMLDSVPWYAPHMMAVPVPAKDRIDARHAE